MVETKKVEHKSLWEALAAFQSELPHVGKDATNPHFKSAYATLEDISAIVLPRLAKHGLAFTSATAYDDEGRLVLNATLAHISGEYQSGVFPVVGQNQQQLGSSMTYGKRYLLCSLTGVAPGGEDDDGNAASAAPAAKQQAKPKAPAGWRKLVVDATTQDALNAIYDQADKAGWATDDVVKALTARKTELTSADA